MAQANLEERYKNLEEKYRNLEEKFNSLNFELERVDAYRHIQNLMGRYMMRHDHGAGPGKRVKDSPELYALKTPGVSAEIAGWGYYQGPEKVKWLYEKGHGDQSVPWPGFIGEHDLTTPVIEIAKDGQSAKATWFCPGFGANPGKQGSSDFGAPEKGPQNARFAGWRWHKIGAAFVKEEGVWKMWKYHVYSTFFTDYYKSLLDSQGDEPSFNPKSGAEPPSYNNPYRLDTIREPVPAPPEPYDTMDQPPNWRGV